MDKKVYEEFAESLVNAYKTPGAIVALNNQIYEKGFGYRDKENELPVTADTILELEVSQNQWLVSQFSSCKKREIYPSMIILRHIYLRLHLKEVMK